MSETVLSQGVGYAVVIGIGLAFTGLMLLLTFIQSRYTGYKASNSEEFNSASRSVKPGLIASGIVSSWTVREIWAATLLQSSTVAYKFGLSGPYWYASGATVQVLLFSMNAAKLKINAPFAHTPFEIVRKRWENLAHILFLMFALGTNIVVSSMLILGGSDTVAALTGMSTLAASYLIPMVVVLYVVVGGMRATLLCDYSHTTILLAVILTFMFSTYATSGLIGSPSKMYELLVAQSDIEPVSGNAQGSYLTLSSKSGGIFGVINVVGNFGTIYLDQAYWQRAVASRPSSAVKGYMLGGLAWFSVPFGFATTMGLAAVALKPYISPPLTTDQVSAGLAAPTAAAALLGQSGATTILVLLFLAVTSATSAELIAVSSVVTYDLWIPYVNPKANERQVFWVSHATILAYGVLMGVLGTIWYYIGVSLGWVNEAMGVWIGGGVVPLALAIMSTRANKWGCIGGAVAGICCGLIAWLVTAATLNGGKISIDTTFQDYPMLAGNLASIGVGGIISVVTTLIWPEHYNFEREYRYNATATTSSTSTVKEIVQESQSDDKIDEKDSSSDKVPTLSQSQEAVPDDNGCLPIDDPELDVDKLNHSFNLATIVATILFFSMLIILPFPLVFTKHIYSVAGFTTWVVLAFIWVFVACFIVILIIGGIAKDIKTFGKGKFDGGQEQ